MSSYMRDLRSRIGNRLLEIPAAAVAVRDDRGRVLLVKSLEGGVWIFPGGAVEPLEVPAEAALREVWEEAGVLAEITSLLGVYGGPEYRVTYANGDDTSFLMVLFGGRVDSGSPRADGIETSEVAFVSRDDAAQLPLAPWMREPLADVYAARPGPLYRTSAWRPADA